MKHGSLAMLSQPTPSPSGATVKQKSQPQHTAPAPLAQSGFMLIDLAHQYCFANPIAAQQLQLPRVPEPGWSLTTLLAGFAPPARHLLYQAMWRCLATEQWQQLTLPMMSGNDHRRVRFLLLCIQERGRQRLCAFIRVLPSRAGIRPGRMVEVTGAK